MYSDKASDFYRAGAGPLLHPLGEPGHTGGALVITADQLIGMAIGHGNADSLGAIFVDGNPSRTPHRLIGRRRRLTYAVLPLHQIWLTAETIKALARRIRKKIRNSVFCSFDYHGTGGFEHHRFDQPAMMVQPFRGVEFCRRVI